MKYLFLLFIGFLTSFAVWSQNHHHRFQSIDVQHYKFEIHLNDSTDRIEGSARIAIKILQATENILLDFITVNDKNKGMLVQTVKVNGHKNAFIHSNNSLRIPFSTPLKVGKTIDLQISYSGIPVDGLIISENNHGQRTFFGDNWPDRAKHWLPTVDHPSDKATLEFLVYAPKHYEVVANGYLIEKKVLPENIEFTHWKEDVPVSTKLMVIGTADFSVGNKTTYNEIPVSSWIFQQDSLKGFKNYRYGTKALEYFSNLIGPYPYEKLAHVQSKTRYGGMENASCIFYHERTATSDRSQENLFAHEVAHQWFGNSVTEQNWHHVWLSEGFATYLTHVYNQYFYGEKVFQEGLKQDRKRVIQYSKKHLSPIIDTTVTDYIQLLNPNSYQKASWFLHMLRHNLGDETFFKGLQKYYSDFNNSTALTTDFLTVMSEVSNKHLDDFFDQWLWQDGHPLLNLNWKQNKNELVISLKQVQKQNTFSFQLEAKILYKDNSYELVVLNVNALQTNFRFNIPKEIEKVIFDPETNLLFEQVNPEP